MKPKVPASEAAQGKTLRATPERAVRAELHYGSADNPAPKGYPHYHYHQCRNRLAARDLTHGRELCRQIAEPTPERAVRKLQAERTAHRAKAH